MESSKFTEFKVGLLALVAITLFVISILMLGADTAFFKPTYHVRVIMDQVQGLRHGSVVRLLGIPVGNIEKIDLVHKSDDHVLEVTLKLEKEFQNQITEGSVAGTRTQGALGDKFIYISPGAPTAKPIEDGGTIALEARGDLFDTLTSNTDKVQKMFDVIEEAHQLLSQLTAQGRPAALMHNLVVTSEEMKQLVRELRGSAGEGGLKTAITRMDHILAKIDNGTGTLGALVNDRSVFEGIKRFVGSSGKEKTMKSLIRETIQSSEQK